jgi:hypothetical protein
MSAVSYFQRKANQLSVILSRENTIYLQTMIISVICQWRNGLVIIGQWNAKSRLNTMQWNIYSATVAVYVIMKLFPNVWKCRRLKLAYSLSNIRINRRNNLAIKPMQLKAKASIPAINRRPASANMQLAKKHNCSSGSAALSGASYSVAYCGSWQPAQPGISTGSALIS